MDLKVRRSGLLQPTFDFFEGNQSRFTLSNTPLIGHGDITIDDQELQFRSCGLGRRLFVMKQNDHILATAKGHGIPSWYCLIEYDGRQYLLQGDSLWKMTLYLGGKPVGSVARDEILPFDGFVWGFDGSHNALWSFSFWLALKYWGGKRQTRKPPSDENVPGAISWD